MLFCTKTLRLSLLVLYKRWRIISALVLIAIAVQRTRDFVAQYFLRLVYVKKQKMKEYCNIYLYILFLILCVTYSSCLEWKEEGESCMDGTRNGTCMALNKCRTRTPKRNIRDYPLCSIARRARIICCAHEKTRAPVFYSEKPITDPITGQALMKIGQKSWDKCLDYLRDVNYPCKGINHMNHVSAGLENVWERRWGKSKQPNRTIAGGQNARRTQYPHMALLGYGDEKRSIDWICGGSLISDRFILTAGHCTASPTKGPVKYIALGVLKRTDPHSIWQRHTVQRIIAHPDYHSPIKYNDIALLQTARRVIFGPNVTPACLSIPRPPQSHSTIMQDGFSATGWGFLGQNRALADTLQVVYLEEFNYRDCARIYKPHRHMPQGYNITTQVCYGNKMHAKDTCQGDSGGPMQTPGQTSDCQYSIVAVTSYGISCPSEAGMYTRVSAFLPWIESIVWP